MTTEIKILAIVVGCFLGYYLYWQHQYESAEADARQFCASTAEGSDISEAITRAESLKGIRHGFTEPDQRYTVYFRGPIFNMFTCELTVAAGKVTSRRAAAIED